MEVTNVHLLRWNKGKSLTANLHHVLSTVTIDDPELFTNFRKKHPQGYYSAKNRRNKKLRGILRGLTSGEWWRYCHFFKDTHAANNARAAAQRILISNNVTQGLKSMLFEIKYRGFWNDFPDELALRGTNTEQLSIMRKNRADTKEHLKRRQIQSNTDMKVTTLTGTNFEEFD